MEMGLKTESFSSWLGLPGDQLPARSPPELNSIEQKILLVLLRKNLQEILGEFFTEIYKSFRSPCVRDKIKVKHENMRCS